MTGRHVVIPSCRHVGVSKKRRHLAGAMTRRGAEHVITSRAAVEIDKGVNFEAVGLSCSEGIGALAEKLRLNARSGVAGKYVAET